MWRETLADGILPFGGYTGLQKELEKKKLKDFKPLDAFEAKIFNFVSESQDEYLNKETKMKYETKTILYCTSLNKYV